jgi:hypothetical protein
MCGGQCVPTDNNNCGGCGVVCAGTCSAGHCGVTLASGLTGPSEVRVNAANVYWNGLDPVHNSGIVMTAPLSGGTPTTLYAIPPTFQGQVGGIDIDATNLYWTTGPPVYGVLMMPLGGGSVSTIATTMDVPVEVRAFGSRAFFTTYYSGDVIAVPIAGGPATALYSNGSQAPQTDVAPSASDVYFSVQGELFSVPTGGGSVSTIVGLNGGDPWHLVVDSANVYWADYGSWTIMQAPLSGGPAITLASTTQPPGYIAVDTGAVYFTAGVGCSVCSVPIGGGAVKSYASGYYAEGIAVDATYIYWAVNNSTSTKADGAIMRVAK